MYRSYTYVKFGVVYICTNNKLNYTKISTGEKHKKPIELNQVNTSLNY